MARRLCLASLLAAAGVVSFAAAHECVHDTVMHNLGTTESHDARQLREYAENSYDVQMDTHGRVLQETFAPIRIRVDTSRLFPNR